MRLTLALFKKRNVIPGNIWIGKHRINHKAFPWNVEADIKKLQREEQNLFYLRHPYLTPEEGDGFAKELGKHEKWLYGKQLDQNALRMKRSVRMEERLNHLRVSEAWDC